MTRTSRKRKMPTPMDVTPSKIQKLDDKTLTPTSKTSVIKVEAFLCNNRPLHKLVELGDEDYQRIWTKALGKDWDDVKGCIGKRFDSSIKITFELFNEVSIRSIINDLEFNYQRNALVGPETFTLRILGLHNIREAKIGEVIRVNARGTNFEVKPVEILQWMEEYGRLVGDFRYSFAVLFSHSLLE